MNSDGDNRQRARDAARTLRRSLAPERIVVDDAELDRAAALWNGAVTHRASIVVRCTTIAHVQAAVTAARANGLPLSVRGGGHDWAGRAIRPGGLVIDLSRMRRVAVHGRIAVADGGATVRDVAQVADRHGLAAVAGSSGDSGMAGLTLGGGYGPLNGRFGLAADNLTGAEVVLADGRLVDTDTDPGLLWALRGGGGNFGVVCSQRIALHDVGSVLAAQILFPWPQAETVVRRFADLVATTPDELTAYLALLAAPDGGPVVAVVPTWSGGVDDGRSVVDDFVRLGTPLSSTVAAVSPLDLVRRGDGQLPSGRHYMVRTRTLPALTPDATATLLRAFEDRTAPTSMISVFHLHGRAANTPLDAGAFAMRRDHVKVDITAAWVPGPGSEHEAWATRTSESLREHALPGGYPNVLGPDDVAQADRAFGPNTSRLLAVKARLDPDGVFTATPLPRPHVITRRTPVRRT